VIEILGYTYNWSFQDIVNIPLDKLRIIMPDAIERYKVKLLLEKAILKFLGVKDI